MRVLAVAVALLGGVVVYYVVAFALAVAHAVPSS